MLASFASYLHEQGAERITTRIALEWAVLPADASRWWWQQAERGARVRKVLQAFDLPPKSRRRA